jgi:hypothetical protein
VDKALGNKAGWDKGFEWKTEDQGIATHVFAAFHPSLDDGKSTSLIDASSDVVLTSV